MRRRAARPANTTEAVRAIAEGRRQFDNIARFVRYLLASNSAELIALAVNLVLGGPLILLPIHILWINLLTDGPAALALGLEPGHPGQMRRPPMKPDARILSRAGMLEMMGFGLYIAAAALLVFYALLPQGAELARTAAFSTLVACQLLAVFAFRSRSIPALRLGVRSNPWLVAAVMGMLAMQAAGIYWPPLQAVLGTVPLAGPELTMIAIAAAPVTVVPTLVKLWRRSGTPPIG